MNEFINGATYQIVSDDWTNGHFVTYDKSQHRFQCKGFNFYASFLVTKNCNIKVKLMTMGPAPAMPAPRPFANIEITDEDMERFKDSFSRGQSTLNEARAVFADHSNKFFKPTPLNQARVSMGREPIKSDGLSSSYYSLMINGTSVETEDVIRDVFGNDFDFGNVFKCLVRMYGAKQGAGKAGAAIEYDGNKIHYSINKITGKGNDRG